MTTNLSSKTRGRGASVCGLGGLALASVLLLCGAGNLPIENFTPQGAMQADLNAGGHNLLNAATVSATNVAAATLTATNVTVSGSLTAPNFTLPFASLTGTPATLAGYGITNAYTQSASDARYSPLAGSSSLTTVGAVTAGSFPYANLTGTPTTLAGYGITNAYTESASDARYSPLAGSSSLTTVGAVTAGSFPYANLTGNPVSVAAAKTLAVSNSLTLAGTDGSTLNVGTGGTLGSAAFAATSAFLAPSAIGATVQGYNAATTTLGNAVNGANDLVQTDGNGLLLDAVLRPAAKTIYVSQGLGSNTRTGLSKYSLHTPFATLAAAAAVAAAGDTIVVEDGVFTDKNIALASGVDWLFLPNATVTVTGAANGDAIFKDNATAVTAVVAGYGQTFSIASTASGATVSVLAITGASNVTVQDISFAATETGLLGAPATLSSSNASAVIAMSGNVSATGSTASNCYALLIGSSGGGTISIKGNVTASSPGLNAEAINCVSSTTSSGNVTVMGTVSSNVAAISGSSACQITCGNLVDGTGPSLGYNRLTLLGVGPLVQTVTSLVSGFNVSDTMGPEDHLFELMPSGTLASGGVVLPYDAISRIGERVTVTSTQTITSLTVSVPYSGTLYGYSAASLGPGAVTFEKIGSNTWIKL